MDTERSAVVMAKAEPDIPYPPRPRDPGRPVVLAAFALSALAAAWFLVPRTTAFRTPAPLGKAGAVPYDIRRAEGTWYWVERPAKAKARLMAAKAGATPRTVAEEDAIDAFDVAGNTIAWTAKSGSAWVVRASDGQGAPRTLRSASTEAHGPCVDGSDIVWTERTAPAAPGLESLPTLGGSLQVVRCAATGGAPTVAATLPDAGRGVVVGRIGEAWWVAALRIDYPGSTVVWQVPVQGGAPKRMASVSGPNAPVRTASGDLLLLSPSRESTSPVSSRVMLRLGADGRIERLADWLPEGGAPYDGGASAFYVDRESPPVLWRPRGTDQLPEMVPAPSGHHAIAVGEGHLLLSGMGADDLELSEVAVP